jgi:hypothetical protein
LLPRLNSINGQDAADFWRIVGPDAVQEQWRTRVAGLAGAAQVQAVRHRFLELNPGHAGIESYDTDGAGAITRLKLAGGPVKDLRPLAVLKALRQLEIGDTQGTLKNLEPLRGLPLQKLIIGGAPIVDLAPLAGMPLEELSVATNRARDLGPLRDSKLQRLFLPLAHAHDLAPLARLPLRHLDLAHSGPRDLGPLAALPLESIRLLYAEVHHRSALYALKLQRINDKSAEKFWQEQAELQLQFIRRELMRLNPSFDGQLRATIQDGTLLELTTVTTQVLDLGPVRAARDLKRLWSIYDPQRHRDLLRSMATLQEINGQPAAVVLR